MIRLERVVLPEGLRALAYRDHRGNLVVYVSDRLDARGQRTAVMEAVRASRRAGWRRTGLPPVGVALFLAIRALLRQAGRTVGTRSVAWGAAATATVVGASAAAVFVVAAPHPHGPSAAGLPTPGRSAVRSARPSAQPSGGNAPHRRQARPVAVASVSPGAGRPAGTGQPRPAPTSPAGPAPAPAPAPDPAPSPTSTQPAPAPSPSPSPSPSGGAGVCVIVLGIKVCLPALSAGA